MRPSSDFERFPGDAGRDQVFRAVYDYRYFAPAYLAMEERHRQDLAEAALAARLSPADPTRSRSADIIRALHWTGGALVRAGQRLQGVGRVYPRADALD
jgi:hypothetical protein